MRGPGVVFVGNLPSDVKEKEVDDLFYKARSYWTVHVLAAGRRAGAGHAWAQGLSLLRCRKSRTAGTGCS